LLTPVNERYKELLRKDPFNFTFDHNGCYEYLTKLSQKFETVSLDLTLATDRTDATPSRVIDKYVFTPVIASKLHSLICESYYAVEGEQNPIKYAVGQPMGTLCSFNKFSLFISKLHEFCSWMELNEIDYNGLFDLIDPVTRRISLDRFEKFKSFSSDCVCEHGQVGDDNALKKGITEILFTEWLDRSGVHVSIAKCRSVVNGVRTWETCSRVGYLSKDNVPVDVSRLGCNLLLETIRNPGSIINLLIDYEKRGVTLSAKKHN